jgi:transcription initiation factor TFIIIB Brf1 subunit/transcription initiation factor TFIIB
MTTSPITRTRRGQKDIAMLEHMIVNHDADGQGGNNRRGDSSYVSNKQERSIQKDLEKYTFPDDIKNMADVIYSSMNYQMRRGKKRDMIVFHCTYSAHLELDREVNPIQLGMEVFKLTKEEITRCDSIFSPLQTGYRPPSKDSSPLNYIPDYCRRIGLSEDATALVLAHAKKIMTKSKGLDQEHPQTIAAGILRYYLITNGIELKDKELLTRVTGRSIVTIDTACKSIALIDAKK